MNSIPTVIIFGHSPASNIGLARALASRGCTVDIVCNTAHKKRTHPEAKSRYVRDFHFLSPAAPENTIAYLTAHYADCSEKPILIATSDKAAEFFDSHYDALSAAFLLPRLSSTTGSAQRLMDKSYQKELARRSGFSVLPSQEADLTKTDYTIPEGVEYPCFVKGVRSVNTAKWLAKRCDSREELTAHLSLIAKKQPSEVLIEKYARIEKEWGLMALCNGQDVRIPALTELTVLSKGRLAGVSILGTVRSAADQPELLQTATAFLQSLDMTGICNIDLIQMDGKFYFSELNIRYAAYGYAIAHAGANLPGMYVSMMRGEALPPCRLEREETTYFSECSAADDLLSGKLTIGELRALKKTADIGLLTDKNDMRPSRIYCRHVCAGLAKNCLKTILRTLKH